LHVFLSSGLKNVNFKACKAVKFQLMVVFSFLFAFFTNWISYPPVYDISTIDGERILFIQELEYIEDSTRSLTFEEVKEQRFHTNASFQPRDYNPSSAYWVKVRLYIPKDNQEQWLIEFYDQTIDNLRAYVPTVQGDYRLLQFGDQFPFEQKTFEHKNFEVLINDRLEGMQTFYFRIESHAYVDIRIVLSTINQFVHYALNEYFLYGIFYGMILMIILYNILIYIAIREIKNLYYTFYILSVGVFAMCVDGIAYQYLWPNWPEWNQVAHGVALFSVIFWSILFSRKFLNVTARAPKLTKIIDAVLILRSLWFLFALVFDHELFQLRNIEIIPLSIIFYASIYVWARGYKPARFFVVAYGFLFLGFLVKAMVMLSVIPISIPSYYSLHVSFVVEMLFLSFALSDRVRILKSMRDRALFRIIKQHEENMSLKDKVNKELEQRIRLRTIEMEDKNNLLREVNEKLTAQTKEISQINSILDLDNWKLKNNIKEILQNRLVNKNLTLEEFNGIFPDKLSCYRFLERIKWEESFKCNKCNNDKYITGKDHFSRRCSRCGYIESVTSNTIFHGIRFPIEKAFYILYVTNNQSERFTLDQLSEMLDLRRNTIWSFKKKIEELLSTVDKPEKDYLRNFFMVHSN
tara:strand:+ start:27302 stop:29206 length:1905 start_codon:yes stop_codon:yes gene_type:complete